MNGDLDAKAKNVVRMKNDLRAKPKNLPDVTTEAPFAVKTNEDRVARLRIVDHPDVSKRIERQDVLTTKTVDRVALTMGQDAMIAALRLHAVTRKVIGVVGVPLLLLIAKKVSVVSNVEAMSVTLDVTTEEEEKVKGAEKEKDAEVERVVVAVGVRVLQGPADLSEKSVLAETNRAERNRAEKSVVQLPQRKKVEVGAPGELLPAKSVLLLLVKLHPVTLLPLLVALKTLLLKAMDGRPSNVKREDLSSKDQV
jgi:hypothetical protein